MRPAAAVGRQLKVGRDVALNQFLNHIALVSSHYGTNARVPERGFVFGHCPAGPACFKCGQGKRPKRQVGLRGLRINEDCAYVWSRHEG